MEDYPRNQAEFERRFGSEEACQGYLFRLRWPDGFVCPRCNGRQGWPTKRGLVMCRTCGHQSSLRAGTIFDGSRKPLGTWFRAIWYLTGAKSGASAVTVRRMLGLGGYQTAWTWLHKLRRAMVSPGRDRLSGRVEVDEMYWGGGEEGVMGRAPSGKALVAIAAQEDGAGTGRIRMRRVADASAASLQPFVAAVVEPGSVVHTDGWEGYTGLEGKGYRHEVTLLKKRPQAAVQWLPRVHRIASLLRRWLMGTHHGAVSHEHLDYYLDEFTFRFNRRTSASRGKLFYRLLQNAVRVPPATYQSMIKGLRGRKKKAHPNR